MRHVHRVRTGPRRSAVRGIPSATQPNAPLADCAVFFLQFANALIGARFVTGRSENRELVFGLIAPIGVDREPVLTALRDELRKVQYDLELIHVSERLKVFSEPFKVFSEPFNENDFLKRKAALMDAGNRMREWHRAGDAAAVLSMVQIGEARERRGVPETILNSHAYVIDSLKHPAEVERLRSVYGQAFIGIGIYEPPENRRQRMADLARTLLSEPDFATIDQLIDRDEDEQAKFGQKVRAAFELSDFVLDLSRPKSGIDAQVWRLIRCLFGDVQATPTKHEYGMSLARVAQAKSGSLARQVGAAVIRPDGSVAAMGTNEVAKPGGGQYTEADDDTYQRGRDVTRDQDSSDYYRHKALTDLIKLLQKARELAPHNTHVDPDKLFERWWNSQDDPGYAVRSRQVR
jgi:cytidine deaminase